MGENYLVMTFEKLTSHGITKQKCYLLWKHKKHVFVHCFWYKNKEQTKRDTL